MKAAHNLDRSITIQRATSTTNEYNEPVVTWADYKVLRAERSDVSDGEKYAAGQVGSVIVSRFVVRSNPESRTITPVDRIAHEGHTWSIHGVKETGDGRFRFIEITAAKDADAP